MNQNQDTVLKTMDQVFGQTPRPEHFTNANHCCECAEYDQLFQSYEPHMLMTGLSDSTSQQGFAFLSMQGYCYLMPTLARLALVEGDGYFLDGFLANIRPDRAEKLTMEQKDALLNFLDYIEISMADAIKANPFDGYALESARRILIGSVVGEE